MATPFANSGDPNQTSHYVAPDLGQHCLSITLFGPIRLKWVKLQTHHPSSPVVSHLLPDPKCMYILSIIMFCFLCG